MNLIIGLGNPGDKFKKTRHNLGWDILDLLKEKWDFPEWKRLSRLKSNISKKDKIILAKPQTFMNLSGLAVKSLKSYYKARINNLIIIQDDIDIELGKIKISKNRGTAGHKGVQSIIDSLGTKNFIRIRIGIKPKDKKTVDKFVLSRFSKEEKENIEKAKTDVLEAIEIILNKDLSEAMKKFN